MGFTDAYNAARKIVEDKNIRMKIKKIVLAYSDGLDTSVILKWLQEKYKAEIICYTADLGQNIDRKTIYKNAKKLE